MNDWHYCESCDSEFKVVSDNLDDIIYCPFCSEEIEQEEDDEDEDGYWSDDD